MELRGRGNLAKVLLISKSTRRDYQIFKGSNYTHQSSSHRYTLDEMNRKKIEMEKLWHVRTSENIATSKNRYDSPSERGIITKLNCKIKLLFFKDKIFNTSRKKY